MTTLKTLSVAVALTLVPSLSLAMGCSFGDHQKQAQSCVTGTAWDAASQSCQPVVNS